MKIKRSFKDSQTDQMPILSGQNRSRALALFQNFQLLVAAGLSFLICGVPAFAQFSSTTTAVDPTAGAQSWRRSLRTAFCISWPAQLSFASAGTFFRLFSSRLEGIMEIALGLIVFGLILKRGLVELELPTKEESEL